MIKRHERPRSQGDLKNAQAGGIVEKEGPIHVSNVMLLDPKGNKADPGRRPPRRRRQARPLREAQRGGDRLMEATATPTSQAAPPPRLRERYEQEILPELTRKFGYSTPMQAPRLIKITLNMGLGTEKQDKKLLRSRAGTAGD